MNEEKLMDKRQKKKLEKTIKKINGSLSFLPSSYKKKIDVCAYQKEDSVFFCGNGNYKKIYIFRPASLGNKRSAFIKAITDHFDNRIRFTICLKNKDKKLSAYMFMTVNFTAASYYEARQIISDFEKALNETCTFLGITFNQCTIEDSITYINMNFTNEMKQISISDFLGRHGHVLLDPQITDCSAGCFKTGDRSGVVFSGRGYSDNTDGINEFYKQHVGSYFIVVDFQGFNVTDGHLLKFNLKSRYMASQECQSSNINMTYFLTAIDDEASSESLSDSIFKFYDSHGIQLMPCAGREKKIFSSCASLGLVDFRSMQNASADIIGGLLF